MKNLDMILIGIVSLVWGVLAIMYATISMIYMPNSIRVWGAGAVIFLALTAVIAMADASGRKVRENRNE
ncbi:MAG: hypothetical protein IIC04_06725 [Proteobacteria bacterium]|nr:hypothetical protein [Pseudomonadota bacterium]